ncbi:hypothetical protein [Arthrobacter sp. B1I2]|uniref:hypothetical protein n=1 Tax=Arthrobacter sp. B1I2 TaxID=3042263 RepID=UPI0027B9F978|nr:MULTISPECIES: hypothetical protein [Arthrobacter]
MHSPGAAAAVVPGAGDAGADVAGGEDAEDGGGVVDAGDEGDWLACPVAGGVVVWDCGWLAPHAVSSRAAAAAAVVMANPWEIF